MKDNALMILRSFESGVLKIGLKCYVRFLISGVVLKNYVGIDL